MSRGIDVRLTKPASILAIALVGLAAMLEATTAYAATTITVTDTADPESSFNGCTLRDAMRLADGESVALGDSCAETGTGAPHTIVFSVTGKINLSRAAGPLPAVIATSLTINGPATSPGITIDAGDSYRVLEVILGTLNINNLTITEGNARGAPAGGVAITDGTLVATNCTFSNNSGTRGGGIANDARSTLTVTNSTFSANRALLGGGAILNVGTLKVSNSTFSGNGAPIGGGILNEGRANLKGTILAHSLGGNCSFLLSRVVDDGYNISDDRSCDFKPTGSAPNGDDINPKLTELGDNGGPTLTFDLEPDSPAIDAIPPADCTYLVGPNPCTTSGSITNQLTCDQRGSVRPAAGQSNCDIGAVEPQT